MFYFVIVVTEMKRGVKWLLQVIQSSLKNEVRVKIALCLTILQFTGIPKNAYEL